jgi:hypothetical protein
MIDQEGSSESRLNNFEYLNDPSCDDEDHESSNSSCSQDCPVLVVIEGMHLISGWPRRVRSNTVDSMDVNADDGSSSFFEEHSYAVDSMELARRKAMVLSTPRQNRHHRRLASRESFDVDSVELAKQHLGKSSNLPKDRVPLYPEPSSPIMSETRVVQKKDDIGGAPQVYATASDLEGMVHVRVSNSAA